ncbi:MAG: hypothetical protein MUF18_02400 [Fimbriiglobus sp.]|nr:hypothetical protein [Fimbriiglobus sp.]
MRLLASLSTLLLTAILNAAPVPEDKEKPKPRAKLLGTVTVNAEVLSAFWLADGKHFALATLDHVLVYPREAIGTDAPKPLTTLSRPDHRRSFVDRGPDGGLFLSYYPTDKVNAESRLSLWTAKTLLAGGAPKPDRVVELDDGVSGVTPSSDGRTLFAVIYDRRPKTQQLDTRFVRLSGTTGNERASLRLADMVTEGDGLLGYRFDPNTDRLYLATITADRSGMELQCREADGGKRLWTARLPGEPAPVEFGQFADISASDGGRVVVVRHSVRLVRPVPPNQRPPGGRPEFTRGEAITVIDGQTGEVRVAASREPKGESSRESAAAVSPDGRLVFANTGERLSVWEVATGEEVKGWERPAVSVLAAFAPKGKELLLVQREWRDVFAPAPPGRNAPRLRTEDTSTAGLWDLSPVLK